VTDLAGEGLVFAPVETFRNVDRKKYVPVAVARKVTEAVVTPVL
jgi:hypothetical protein